VLSTILKLKSLADTHH